MTFRGILPRIPKLSVPLAADIAALNAAQVQLATDQATVASATASLAAATSALNGDQGAVTAAQAALGADLNTAGVPVVDPASVANAGMTGFVVVYIPTGAGSPVPGYTVEQITVAT